MIANLERSPYAGFEQDASTYAAEHVGFPVTVTLQEDASMGYSWVASATADVCGMSVRASRTALPQVSSEAVKRILSEAVRSIVAELRETVVDAIELVPMEAS